MALHTHCLVARKEAAMQGMQVEGLKEKEYGMVKLKNVGDVLFQALLLDNIRFEKMFVCAEYVTVYHYKR